MSTEAMKQALEALDGIHPGNMTPMAEEYWNKAITALRTAIEQAEKQEPVALETVYETIIHWDEGGGKRSRRELARRIVDLYTTPPSAPVQGLEKGCHRSHPHENMDAMCELRTEIARLTNEKARLKAAQRQRVSLTDEQINELRQQYGVTSDGRGIKEFTYVCDFVRAIEAKLRKNGGAA